MGMEFLTDIHLKVGQAGEPAGPLPHPEMAELSESAKFYGGRIEDEEP